jgi:hypothetical protein
MEEQGRRAMAEGAWSTGSSTRRSWQPRPPRPAMGERGARRVELLGDVACARSGKEDGAMEALLLRAGRRGGGEGAMATGLAPCWLLLLPWGEKRGRNVMVEEEERVAVRGVDE